MKNIDLPETIPVFPLPGALLLPRAKLPLHIFEPRYLQMLEDAMKTKHRLIGMVQPREVPGSCGKAPAFHRLRGPSDRVFRNRRWPLYDHPVGRVAVSRAAGNHRLYPLSPLHCRLGTLCPRSGRHAKMTKALTARRFWPCLGRYFQAMELSTDWGSLKEAEAELLINSLSMLCPFEPEDKQALLEAPSLETRRETLVTLIEFSLRGGTGDEVMQ